MRAWPHIFRRIRGALLVAPADPAHFALNAAEVGGPLGDQAHLVASRTDPWLSFEAACALSRRWRCELIDAGAAGHINPASGHGNWPAGWQMLHDLLGHCEPTPPAGLRSGTQPGGGGTARKIFPRVPGRAIGDRVPCTPTRRSGRDGCSANFQGNRTTGDSAASDER